MNKNLLLGSIFFIVATVSLSLIGLALLHLWSI